MKLIICSLLLSGWGAYAAPDLVLGVRPTVLKNEVIHFKPLAGHHFSAEAPQKCGRAELVEKSVREVTCQFTNPGEAKILLNVCDDKKTFCKPIEFKVSVSESSAQQKILKPLKQSELEQLRKELVPGFIEADVNTIRKMALAQKKPVFVMISTEWCPPCNETKEFLFNNKAFAELSQDWIKVYVDGDSLSASEWEKVVPYKVFPTMAMLNFNLQETGRFTKELRMEEFKSWVTQQQNLAKVPLAELKKRLSDPKGSLGAAEQLHLLNWAIDVGDEALIKDLRKKIPNLSGADEIKLMAYDLEKMNDAEKKKNLIKILKLSERVDDFEDYLEQYCTLAPKECRQLLPKLDKRFAIIAQWKDLTPAEMASALGESAFTQSEIYSELGEQAKAKAAAERCVEEYSKQMKLSKLKVSRSANQAKTHCLSIAGKEEEAEKLVEQLMASYPNESTFVIRMARLKHKKKNYDSALELITKAEKLAYGYNWYSAMLLKAQIEIDKGDKVAAQQTLQKAAEQLTLPQEKEMRNHVILSRIRSLQASLEKPKS